jgi:putative transposase
MSDESKWLKAGQIYHIWTHANGKENLFRCDENYRYFLQKYDHHIQPVANTLAYCLMPNHFHLMIKVRESNALISFYKSKFAKKIKPGKKSVPESNPDDLDKIVNQQLSNLLNAYTKAYNKRYDRKGSLFTSNFGRRSIESKEYAIALLTYIHTNPVKHGFVADINDWKYSSWHAYISRKKSQVYTRLANRWFGSMSNFEEAHKEIQQNKLLVHFEDVE